MGISSFLLSSRAAEVEVEAEASARRRRVGESARRSPSPSIAEWASAQVAEVIDRLSSREADLTGLLAETKAELTEVSRQLIALRQATGELALARAGEEIEEELERMMEDEDGDGQEISLPPAR